MGQSRCGIEVGSRVGEVDIIDGDELSTRTPQFLVIPELLVLTTAHRELSEQLLQLRSVFPNLGGELPVHEALFALRAFQLLGSGFPDYRRFDRALSGEEFANGSTRKIHAGFCQHRVNHARGAIKFCTARSIIAQAGSTKPFLILLIPFLAGLLVPSDGFMQLFRYLSQ